MEVCERLNSSRKKTLLPPPPLLIAQIAPGKKDKLAPNLSFVPARMCGKGKYVCQKKGVSVVTSATVFSFSSSPSWEGEREEGSRDKKERVSFFYLFCYTPEVPLYVPKKAFWRHSSVEALSPLYGLWERNSKGLLYRQKFGKPRGVTNWFVPSKREEEEEKELVNFSLSFLLCYWQLRTGNGSRTRDKITTIFLKWERRNLREIGVSSRILKFDTFLSFPFLSFLSLMLFLWQYLPTSESIYIYIYIFLPFLPEFACQSQLCAADVIRISGLPSSMHCSMACVHTWAPTFFQRGGQMPQNL